MVSHDQPPLPGFDDAPQIEVPSFDPSNLTSLGRGYLEDGEARAAHIKEYRGEDKAVEQGAPDPRYARQTATSEPPYLPRIRQSKRRRPTGGQGPDHHDDPRVEGLDDPYPQFALDTRTDEEREADLADMQAGDGYKEFKAAKRVAGLKLAERQSGGDPVLTAALMQKSGHARRHGQTYDSDNQQQ